MDRNTSVTSSAGTIGVALRKESVDRNYLSLNTQQWHLPVALRKESVDRNYAANAVDQILPGRSPQGERG